MFWRSVIQENRNAGRGKTKTRGRILPDCGHPCRHCGAVEFRLQLSDECGIGLEILDRRGDGVSDRKYSRTRCRRNRRIGCQAHQIDDLRSDLNLVAQAEAAGGENGPGWA